MIIQVISCDLCKTKQQMVDDMVPEEWVRFDGRHYCTRSCFATDERLS